MYINNTNGDEESYYQGFFGYVGEGGAVKNLGVDGGVEVMNGWHVGGVVGYTSNGRIENCYNTGTVTGKENVGGVIGKNSGNTVNTGYSIGNVTGSTNVGGVVGWSWKDDTQSVGEAGTKEFDAVYTSEDTDNYNVVNDVPVQVTVHPTPEPTATPTPEPAETTSPSPTTTLTHSSGGSSTYRVTFNVGENGKITKGNKIVSVRYNTKLKEASIPTVTANEGYKLLGWSMDGKTTVDSTTVAITKVTTFTALYEAETAEPAANPTAKTTQEPMPEAKQHNAYIGGYEGKFNPNGNITRAEISAILARLTDGFGENASYPVSFADVDNALWYSNYIGFEESQNIIIGYQDGTFRPEINITRAEFAMMITRFAKLNTANADIPFTDTDGHWASAQIAACYEAGYIKGYGDNTFLPDNYITRAEAVAIINRVTGRKGIKDFENPFTDVAESHWAYVDIIEAAVTHNAE